MTNHILRELIEDAERIADFLDRFTDESMPLYNETQATLAHEVRLMICGAVANAERQIIGAVVQ